MNRERENWHNGANSVESRRDGALGWLSAREPCKWSECGETSVRELGVSAAHTVAPFTLMWHSHVRGRRALSYRLCMGKMDGVPLDRVCADGFGRGGSREVELSQARHCKQSVSCPVADLTRAQRQHLART